MEKKEYPPTIFIEGIRFFKPRENAPSWIKGNVVITLAELREFIKKNDIKDQMRIDLCKSEKKGTYYFTLNQYKPMAKDTPPEAQNDTLDEF